ncbi:hypothetical protein COT47_02530 [Candidatus Woesearchaeota archaeon CG08_land_8_20_14_0_20_43_7]|nr:MAG: hypothetical protein COT47_02530 [Candidatus Woesearchaeota archaeon CG08_land_8_20_14_0_20_43_7]
MRLKTIVGIALSIAVIVAGSIILFTFAEQLFVAYFIFMVVFLAIWLLSNKDSIGTVDFIFMLFCIFIISGGLSYLASSVKSYHDTWQDLVSEEPALADEMAKLSSDIKYQVTYGQYLVDEIKRYQDSSSAIEKMIADKNVELAAIKQPVVTQDIIVPPTVVVVTPSVAPEDDYYHDDDEREEDDD